MRRRDLFKATAASLFAASVAPDAPDEYQRIMTFGWNVDVTPDPTIEAWSIPPMTADERSAIADPLYGLVIFNTTTQEFNVRVPGGWARSKQAERMFADGHVDLVSRRG